MKAITDSRDYVKNYDWNIGKPIDPIGTEPDRFAPLSGNNNYRSGKLSSFEQMKMLKKKYGIKRIINLAKDSLNHQQDERYNCGGMSVPCEPIWARELGIEYFPIYMEDKPPSNQDWSQIKKILAKGNTLIHCSWGVDRTGTIAGAWRKTIEPNLDNQSLLDYTYSFGGQWKQSGDPNQHLRTWMVDRSYDHKIRKKVNFEIRKVPMIITGITTFLALIALSVSRK